MSTGKITVFFDIDGVLGDFDSHLDAHDARGREGQTLWDKLTLDWWISMPAIRGAADFFTMVAQQADTRFLTAPSLSADCYQGKAQWVQTFLPQEGKYALKRLVIAHASAKQFLAGPNRILIDDRQKNIDEWVAAGGTGILFKGDFAAVAAELKKHLPDLGKAGPASPKTAFPKR